MPRRAPDRHRHGDTRSPRCHCENNSSARPAKPCPSAWRAPTAPPSHGVNGGSHAPSGTAGSGAVTPAYQQLALEIHQTLVDRVELSRLQHMPPEQVRRELAQLVERIIEEGNHPVNESERRRLVSDIQDEMLGYGPLEPLLADPAVSDILVNTAAPRLRGARAASSS